MLARGMRAAGNNNSSNKKPAATRLNATTGWLIEPPRRRQDYPGASRHRLQSSGSLSLQPPSGGSQMRPL